MTDLRRVAFAGSPPQAGQRIGSSKANTPTPTGHSIGLARAETLDRKRLWQPIAKRNRSDFLAFLKNPEREIRLMAALDGEVVGLGVLVVAKAELRACYVMPEAATRTPQSECTASAAPDAYRSAESYQAAVHTTGQSGRQRRGGAEPCGLSWQVARRQSTCAARHSAHKNHVTLRKYFARRRIRQDSEAKDEFLCAEIQLCALADATNTWLAPARPFRI